jgi:ankyrin repeat protein
MGETLCSSARLGYRKKLKCFKLAGASLNSTNLSGATPLHSAAETGQIKIVQYLIEQNVDPTKMDIYGLTALNIAKMLNRKEIKDMISAHFENHQNEQTKL